MFKQSKTRRQLGLTNRKLRFESLEDRRLLTVNIQAANNDLLISGDGTNNTIAVFQDGGGNLFIYGDTATAITGDGTVSGVVPDTNAGGGRQFNAGLFKNIFISMGAGNDSVQIAGMRAADVSNISINTGNATTADNVSFGQTTFVGNPDTVWGASAVSQSVSITSGNGADTISVNALTAPSLTINAGSGTDAFNIATTDDLTINGNVSIDTGDGGGLMSVGLNNHTTIIDGSFTITGGSGNDTTNINQTTVGNVAGNLSINLGAGDDTVNLAQGVACNVLHGSLYIDLGDSSQFGGSNLHTGNNGVMTVSNNVVVRVTGGDSFLAFDNLVATNLDIQSGTDQNSDTIIVKGNYTGSVTIDSGDASNAGDNFGITANIAKNLTVLGIGGPKNFGLQGTTAGNTSIVFGNGPNTIRVGTSTAVTTGSLSIKGGTAGDLIQVSRLTSTGLYIDSDAGVDNVEIGTNGAVSATNGFTLTLGGGGDTARINSLSAAYLSLEGAEGDNTMTIGDLNAANSTISGLVTVHGGAGNDTLNIDRLVSGNDVIFSLGNGANALNFGLNGIQSSSGSFVISGGTGVDTIKLKQVYMVGNLVVNGGAGDDDINIDGSSAQGVIGISAGDGNDKVTLNAVTSLSDLSVSLGEGNNTLAGTGLNIVKEASVSAGNGNDAISFGNAIFALNLNIAAGGGNNGLTQTGGFVLGNIAAITGGGTDTLQFTSTSAKTVSLDTGAGIDQLIVNNVVLEHLFAVLGADNDNASLINSVLNDYSLLDGGLGADIISFNNVSRPKTTTVNF